MGNIEGSFHLPVCGNGVRKQEKVNRTQKQRCFNLCLPPTRWMFGFRKAVMLLLLTCTIYLLLHHLAVIVSVLASSLNGINLCIHTLFLHFAYKKNPQTYICGESLLQWLCKRVIQ